MKPWLTDGGKGPLAKKKKKKGTNKLKVPVTRARTAVEGKWKFGDSNGRGLGETAVRARQNKRSKDVVRKERGKSQCKKAS